jgi:hypothetical protein
MPKRSHAWHFPSHPAKSGILLNDHFWIIDCGKRGALIVSFSWLFIDAIFELGQKYNSLVLLTPMNRRKYFGK